jgi:hypothetical protein
LDSEYQNITNIKTLGLLTHLPDAVHYNSAGYRKLGHMYYDTYCKSSIITNRKPQDTETNIVINSLPYNRDIMFNCDTYFKPSPIYKNLAIDMFASHSMKINTQATSAFVGIFGL